MNTQKIKQSADYREYIMPQSSMLNVVRQGVRSDDLPRYIAEWALAGSPDEAALEAVEDSLYDCFMDYKDACDHYEFDCSVNFDDVLEELTNIIKEALQYQGESK